MTDHRMDVLRALESTAPISRESVREWMALGDLPTRGAVYSLTDEAWTRIAPELTGVEQCAFMSGYLLECLLTNPTPNDHLHGGFEAAWEMAAWLKHLVTLPSGEFAVASVASNLREAYLRSDEATRERIETGALEHILEEKQLRRHFEDWREHPSLVAAYERSLSWGKAHESGSAT